MSETPAADAPKKGKNKLVLILIVVLVLVLVGGAAAFFMLTRSSGGDEEGGHGHVAPAKKADPKTPPTFFPLENMVVNLADPGGDRFAQIGITLEVDDQKTADQIKQFLPSIRSGILMLTSQRTSDELLMREGKEKLAKDILREVSRPLGYSVPREKPPKTNSGEGDEEDAPPPSVNPIRRVLFSSFIIQ